LTLLWLSVSMKLARLLVLLVERRRLTPEERSPPSTPPRQNRMVATKKHANEAQAKPSR
jgi:hypothetical protein